MGKSVQGRNSVSLQSRPVWGGLPTALASGAHLAGSFFAAGRLALAGDSDLVVAFAADLVLAALLGAGFATGLPRGFASPFVLGLAQAWARVPLRAALSG